MNSTADLLFDSHGPEIRHRSGLAAPDPFIYIYPAGGVPTVFFDAREFEVQKLKLAALKNGVHIEHVESYPSVGAIIAILNKQKITTVKVSPNLPYGIAEALKQAGKKLVIHSYEVEREHKTVPEIAEISAAQHVTSQAFELAWKILAKSTIKRNTLIYRKEILTSEYMKSELRKFLMDNGYDCPEGIIVASGEQSSRPHDAGAGPLRPHECIIIDIFPRSEKSGFFGDMTRTFIKGKVRSKIRELFSVVESVQQEIADSIQIGDRCAEVHQQTIQAFARCGHKTSSKEGFMHGTGHSLGLSVHENPRLAANFKGIIEPGMVFTVEPGLYYPARGGVRIEDIVVFYPDGRKENITHFNKPYFIP